MIMSSEAWTTLAVGASGNLLTLLIVWGGWRKQTRDRQLMGPITHQEFALHEAKDDSRFKETGVKIEEVNAKIEIVRQERNTASEAQQAATAKLSERVAGLQSKVDVGFALLESALTRIETHLLNH